MNEAKRANAWLWEQIGRPEVAEGLATSIARQIRIAGVHVTDSSGKKLYPDWLGIVQDAIRDAAVGTTQEGYRNE